mmetsp:Transcript_59834/g.187840  ORF Transcript_59834/g.187840 Transcript_59834/m.187840 type:complete len:224 (+) Transcript_59834:217-888(+)
MLPLVVCRCGRGAPAAAAPVLRCRSCNPRTSARQSPPESASHPGHWFPSGLSVCGPMTAPRAGSASVLLDMDCCISQKTIQEASAYLESCDLAGSGSRHRSSRTGEGTLASCGCVAVPQARTSWFQTTGRPTNSPGALTSFRRRLSRRWWRGPSSRWSRRSWRGRLCKSLSMWSRSSWGRPWWRWWRSRSSTWWRSLWRPLWCRSSRRLSRCHWCCRARICSR